MTFPEGGPPLAGGAGERQLGPETDIEQLQARLGELLAMSPETAAVQATALQAVTDRVLASTPSPQEQEIARLLHDVLPGNCADSLATRCLRAWCILPNRRITTAIQKSLPFATTFL